MSRHQIASWGPHQGDPPGSPVVRPRPARGCRVKQAPPLQGRVIAAARPSVRSYRPVPKGGRRDLLRALQPWVQAYWSSAQSIREAA